MSFPMTHLCVAKKIVDLKPNFIHNLPQYYLGNLSPDSVHFRDNFKPEYKKISHLSVGDERWGELTNNEEWCNNILEFAFKHRSSENADLVYGHCAHVLTDLRNNIDWWTPFKLKHFNTTKIPDYDKLYDSGDSNVIRISHTEDFNLDIQLYHLTDSKDEIWHYLSESKGIDVSDIIFADELDKIRDNILYRQFKDKPILDSSKNKYITYSELINFIDRAATFICEKLFV